MRVFVGRSSCWRIESCDLGISSFLQHSVQILFEELVYCATVEDVQIR